MKPVKFLELIKLFFLLLVVLFYIGILWNFALFYPYLHFVIDFMFYLSLANIVWVLVYYNFYNKERTFPAVSSTVFCWFAFLKSVGIYDLFLKGGEVMHVEFLTVLTVITLLFLGIYIYKSIIKTLNIGKEVKIQPYALIALSFAAVIFIGTILLFLPVSRAPGQPPLSLTDALFTATSAVCVTGLIVVDTGSYFSLFGQIIILLLIQIGALGIMTFAGFFTIIVGEKMSLFGRYTTRNAINEINSGSTARFLVSIIITTFIIELVGALLLFLRFSRDFPLNQAIYQSLFHAVSAFCNAGFSLFSDSLMRYRGDWLVNLTVCVLIILGGLGFSVLVNVYRRWRGKERRITLHSRLVLTVTAALLVVGTIIFFSLEQKNLLNGLPWYEGLLSSFFSSVTTRTAGFNTLDFGKARETTLFFMVVLMFIGASPGSTGGGVKTTTAAVLLLTIYSTLRERRVVRIFGREFPLEIIRKSMALIFLSLGWVIVVVLILGSVENFTFSRIIFEVVSAFGTVGLSTGITPELSTVSKIIITITMFIGRVGPLTLMLSLGMTAKKTEIRYPEEKILIG